MTFRREALIQDTIHLGLDLLLDDIIHVALRGSRQLILISVPLRLILTILLGLCCELVMTGVLPGDRHIQVRLFLLVSHVFIESLRYDGALQGFLVVLECVSGRINKVFIFTEHAEVALRILIKADTVLEIDCVLSFSTFAS